MFASIQTYLSALMGNVSTQFLRALRDGDAKRASELYHSKECLRDKLEPNLNLGSEHKGNTYLHYAALYGLKEMYKELVLHQRGKPDIKNNLRQNCLHLICKSEEETVAVDSKVKRDLLEFTLTEGLKGMDLQHVLKEKDQEGNTVLHLAAGAGLRDCVELLVGYNADMVATNEEGLTPADLAMKNAHNDIGTSLEARMVFSHEEDETVAALVAEPDPELLQEIADGPLAMKDQDLRSMKDKLLIETAEMLGVNLLTAEVLLRSHGWSKEELLGAWLLNPQGVFQGARVDFPPDDGSNTDFLTSDGHLTSGVFGPELAFAPGASGQYSSETHEERDCGICCVSCDSHVIIPCGHHFCRDCWKQYLEEKILGGVGQAISCPEYACYKLVPLEVIEGVVSREIALKFLSFDLKAFVDSNPNIRWCPHPGCSQAVHQHAPPAIQHHASLSPVRSPHKIKGHTVHCGHEHYFCWDCLGEAHEPCQCKQWAEWLGHVEVMRVKVGDTTPAEAIEAASSRWLVDFSKPCPKCKSPIEKTEGCNHMTCKHCRHDFCWVCLENWKCHNSSTGGYFNCNRYDAQRKAEDVLEQRKKQVQMETQDCEEVNKFMHFHNRYRAHINSLSLEEPLLDKAQNKMDELERSILQMEASTNNHTTTPPLATSHSPDGLTILMGNILGGGTSTAPVSRTTCVAGAPVIVDPPALLGGKVEGDGCSSVTVRPAVDLSFIRDAVKELLKCRRVLKATYCYGYYITGLVSKKQFEHMQGALEQVTEMLAEAVARPHLRKPRLEIMQLTREAREKRSSLVKNVHSGLPLSSNPFLDSATFGMSGLSRDTLESPTLRRFLRDLDSYKPPQAKNAASREQPHVESSNSSSGRRHQQIEEDLQQAMNLSRREFEMDRQMIADVELAKSLSLQNQAQPASSPPKHREPCSPTQVHDLPSSPTPHSTLPLASSWLDQWTRQPLSHSPPDRSEEEKDVELAKSLSLQNQPQPASSPPRHQGYYSPPKVHDHPSSPTPLSTLPLGSSWLDQWTRQPLSYSPPDRSEEEKESPSHWLLTNPPLPLYPHHLHSSSSSSSSSHSNVELGNFATGHSSSWIAQEWGPTYGEDEDLNLAIQESLLDTSPSHSTHPHRQVTSEATSDSHAMRNTAPPTNQSLEPHTLSHADGLVHVEELLDTFRQKRQGANV